MVNKKPTIYDQVWKLNLGIEIETEMESIAMHIIIICIEVKMSYREAILLPQKVQNIIQWQNSAALLKLLATTFKRILCELIGSYRIHLSGNFILLYLQQKFIKPKQYLYMQALIPRQMVHKSTIVLKAYSELTF